jgi:hypothetical protein
MTFLDTAVNTFFISAGGIDFLRLSCAIIIILVIFSTLLYPFET